MPTLRLATGGEELALVLPHADLEGAHAIAERVRTAIEALRITRSGKQGTPRITVSLGVAASAEGHEDALIAGADTAALYEARRLGENRTFRAHSRAAHVSRAEYALRAWVYSMTRSAST